jgi:hypothetical protein
VTPPRAAAPPLWPYLLACAAAAAWIDFSTFHRWHNSDSLVPVLVSLQRWTPFFWNQDRVGMLVPLLAVPFRHPLVNLLVQDGLYLFTGLAALFLLPRYVLRDDTYPLVGAVSAAVFLALASARWQFDYFAVTFYGVWLSLGLGGLLLADGSADGRAVWPRRAAALVLLILAHWAYTAAAVLLGPLVLFRALAFPRPADPARRETWARAALARFGGPATLWQLGLVAASFAAGLVLLAFPGAPFARTGLGPSEPQSWPTAWGWLAVNAWVGLAPHAWTYALLAAGAAGVLLLFVPGVRGRAAAWRGAAVLAAAAVAFYLAIGTSSWVLGSDCADRYPMPAVLCLAAALVTVGAAPLAASLPPHVRGGLGWLAVPALPLAALAVWGLPSLGQVRADLAPPKGMAAEDILDARCTHVAGNYWAVWPAVFRAHWAAYERGEARTVWGVTYRGQATRAQWEATPREGWRVAVAAEGDRDADYYLEYFHFSPLEEMERRPTVRVLRPKSAAPP